MPTQTELKQKIISIFWNSFDFYIGSEAKVYIYPLSMDTYLFFADLEPEANWAHSCAYAILKDTGARSLVFAEWPPQECIMKEMEQIKQPPKQKPRKGIGLYKNSQTGRSNGNAGERSK